MAKVTVEPYLFFKGNAKEAMEFYKQVFGGELTISKMSDVPPGTPTMGGTTPDMVMHASLKGDVNIMASDSPKASPKSAKVELSLGGTDEAQMHKIFDALSEGGEVKMKLEKQFWGDVFGSLQDKYGVDWLMNIGTSM